MGDGPEEAKLKQAWAERGIRNVVFAGFRQKAELPRYYALVDVFVFPTLCDPYGLVADEAMACGLPVISTGAAGEIRDRIEEDVNGYIVPPEDSAALAGAMRTLWLRTLGVNAWGRFWGRRSREGHAPERWAEDFERIMHALIGEAK